jgi:hypothetical protein
LLAGEDERELGCGINEKLEGTGVWMLPNATVVRETRTDMKTLMRFAANGIRNNTPYLLRVLSDAWFGAPFLPALACFGFFRQPWQQSTWSRHLFVLLVLAASTAATFSILHSIAPRFYFVLVPFFSIWAANGVIGVALWTRRTADSIRFQRLSFVPLGSATFVVASLAVLAYVNTGAGARRCSSFIELSPSSRDLREVGLWIGRQQDHRVKIMDVGTQPAFHADAEYVHFPCSSAETAIRFLDAAKVDYLILRRAEIFTDYYDDWIQNGIPDPRAKLVYASGGPNPGAFVVYKWLTPSPVK